MNSIVYFFIALGFSLFSLEAIDPSSVSREYQLPTYYVQYQQIKVEPKEDLLEKSYLFVDLQMSEHEKAVFDKINIEKNKQYNRYGEIHLMIEEVSAFLKEIGNSETLIIEEAAKAIERITLLIVAASGKETAWVCLRATQPHSLFDTPRWHMDGPFYSPCFMPQYKFAAALKGRSTLFYPLTPESRATYRKYVKELAWQARESKQNYLQLAKEERKKLSQIFDPLHAESAPRGYGAFFVVGHEACAALHSEPKLDTPRLFISILPGHTNEIKEKELFDKRL